MQTIASSSNPGHAAHDAIHLALRSAAERNPEIQLSIVAGERFLAVTILDDDTQTYREITSHSACQGAVGTLMRAANGDTMLPEYMIDTQAPIEACVYPVSLDEDDMPDFAREAIAFSTDTLAFVA